MDSSTGSYNFADGSSGPSGLTGDHVLYHGLSDTTASNSNPPISLNKSPVGSTPATSPTFHVTATTRVRRRNRMITSCLECRRRKLKCDKSHPCTNCVKATRDCVFLAPALDQASQLKLTEIKEKQGSLERLLEREVARSTTASVAPSGSERAAPGDEDDDLPAAADEEKLEMTPLAVGDAVYDDDADAVGDALLDLGIQIGRLRITERIGGFFRPKVAEELEFTLSDRRKVSDPGVIPSGSFSNLSSSFSNLSSRDFLRPGSTFITPASGFLFGAPPTQQSTLMQYLPSRGAADRLYQQYFYAVHPICKMLHRPSFEREYRNFWDDINLGIEPPAFIQALVFAVLFSAVVSMDERIIRESFGVAKDSVVENFRLGTETALGRANFLRTTKVETLQAFVMYLLPLCRAEVSRAHSVLVGAAIRMAECMGLHRDGDSYGLNPLETNIRRTIWYQLCFLDIRTCEAQGPRPTIRRDDFDTKLPLNVDDADLHPFGKPPPPSDKWTDATFSLIRFEHIEMQRTIWIDRPRIERRKISLTAVLSKIETFRRNMATKYSHMIDEKIPLHRCVSLHRIFTESRLHVMVLHRYHNSVTNAMPERLRDIMLASGTNALEAAVAMDTTPDIMQWSWYNGAIHQYHVAFLLLMDVFWCPTRKEADRIWPCLDYVFMTDASQPREIKARIILKELQEKTAVYQDLRKMRAPSSMQKHIGQQAPRRVDMGGLGKADEGLLDPETATVGRARVEAGAVYAGVSNGEILWANPSRESPDGGSDATSSTMSMSPGAQVSFIPQPDDSMAEIDWEAFDQLFAPQNTAVSDGMYSVINQGVY